MGWMLDSNHGPMGPPCSALIPLFLVPSLAFIPVFSPLGQTALPAGLPIDRDFMPP